MFNFKDIIIIKEEFREIFKSFDYSKINSQKIISFCIDMKNVSNNFLNEINTNIQPYFFRSNKTSFYGFKEEYRFAFHTIDDYKSNKDQMLKIISDSFFVNSKKNDKTYLFGGLNFDLNDKNYGIWENIPVANFVLPRYILNQDKLIINFYNESKLSGKKIDNILCNYINDLGNMFNTKIEKNNISDLVEINNLITKSDYYQKLNKTIHELKQKSTELTKVVYSRTKKASFINEVPIIDIYKKLISHNKKSMTFLFSINQEIFTIGSSPELILSKSSSTIKSESIAGSNFSRKSDDFKIDTKEVIEQRIVTDYILDFFNKNSKNIKYNNVPIIKKSSSIEHLCTSFSADTINDKNILDLLSEIHPTPAIGGYPKQQAINIIRSYKENRGWYGGPIGWIDSQLDGMFYLNIRSAMGLNNDLYLFSGSGITEKSIAKNEWEETEHKFKLMIDSL